MQEPLIYDFQTESGNSYIYDACTNYTYPVDRLDIKIVKNFKKMSLDELKSFCSKGYSYKQVENSYKKIAQWIEYDKAFFPYWHSNLYQAIPSKKEYFKKLAELDHIILELTQRCILRCKYCVYSGSYFYQRTHSNKNMSWDIAKKAIDYFISLVNSIDRLSIKDDLSISFYGGESLLEFNLMKQCVEYIYAQERPMA